MQLLWIDSPSTQIWEGFVTFSTDYTYRDKPGGKPQYPYLSETHMEWKDQLSKRQKTFATVLSPTTQRVKRNTDSSNWIFEADLQRLELENTFCNFRREGLALPCVRNPFEPKFVKLQSQMWEKGNESDVNIQVTWLWRYKMHRKHKVLILSLISIGLIYFFGLALPIFNFFATVIYRLQYFK